MGGEIWPGPLIIIHSVEFQSGSISILKRRPEGRREVPGQIRNLVVSVHRRRGRRRRPRRRGRRCRCRRRRGRRCLRGSPLCRGRRIETRRCEKERKLVGLNVCTSRSCRAIIARCGIAFVATSIGHVSMF